MPMLGGSHDPWPFSCSLNLASCRQRAETLARQLHGLHANLWSPRSSFSSDGGSRSVSPSFGFISPAALQPLVVVDRPAILSKSLRNQGKISSLDDDEDEEEDAFCLDQSSSRSSDVDIVVTPPAAANIMSPPKTPHDMTQGDTQIVSPLPSNDDDFYVQYRGETRIWMPDSPPESFGSESLPPDSPGFTMETQEHSATPSSSTETISEIASPTIDLVNEKSSALAQELCTRLRQFENLQFNGRSVFSPQMEEITVEDVEVEEPSSLTNISETNEESSKSEDSAFLMSPETCPRLIRSTSLKTGKTPPDTPNRKKFVRFADALGLDLEAVRHFVEDEDVPCVPQSAFADLKTSASAPLPWVPSPGQNTSNFQFLPQFKQPAADPYFLDKVRMQKVCLENLLVTELRVCGVVRVLNLGYEKEVIARYTTTEWAVYTDLVADYAPKSCDGFSDKFTFTIDLPHLCVGQRLVLAVKYVANGQEFWDNNTGQNYVLRVQNKPNNLDCSSSIPRWSHHFM